jgi:hypothetical protein
MQNQGSTVCAVQPRMPTSQHLSLRDVDRGVCLAPGMSTTFNVIFTGSDKACTSDYIDEVRINYDGGFIAIPVRCLVPRPALELEGDLEFGILPIDIEEKRLLRVQNKGPVEGEWSLVCEGNLNVFLNPSSGRIPPCSTSEVELCVKDADVGTHTSELVLSSGGHDYVRRTFHVNVVRPTQEVVDSNGAVVNEVCLTQRAPLFTSSTYWTTSCIFNSGRLQ